jgi:hypothetical protein
MGKKSRLKAEARKDRELDKLLGRTFKSEDEAAKVITHNMTQKWSAVGLPGQVKDARNFLRMLGVGRFKDKFLPGFREDLTDKLDQGATSDEIVRFYLGCPEFVLFWHDIGMNEENLREMIPQRGAVPQPEKEAVPVAVYGVPLDAPVMTKKGLFSRFKGMLSYNKDKIDLSVVKASALYGSKLDGMLTTVLRKKADKIANKGYAVTLERLMDKWEALQKLGFNETVVRDRCQQVLDERPQ